MKLSIAITLLTITVNGTAARLHPDDESKKKRKLQRPQNTGPSPSNNLDGRLTEVETNLTLAQDAIVTLQGDVVHLDAEDSNLRGLINTANTAIATANANITALASHLDEEDDTLRGRINAADTAIDTANANITALASRLEAAEATISAAVATISALTARLQVLEPMERIVFVTSDEYTGSLIDGIAGADLKCQDLADAAGLSGTFKAWLSNSTGYSPDQDFVKSGGPFVTTTGIQVADDWQDLITDDGSGYLDNSITFDEDGFERPHSNVWTGTSANGMPDSNGGGTFCSDWTSTSGNARIGESSNTEPLDERWTSIGEYPCIAELRLYCFEQ